MNFLALPSSWAPVLLPLKAVGLFLCVTQFWTPPTSRVQPSKTFTGCHYLSKVTQVENFSPWPKPGADLLGGRGEEGWEGVCGPGWCRHRWQSSMVPGALRKEGPVGYSTRGEGGQRHGAGVPHAGGGRGGQRGYRGGTRLPNSPSAPSPSPAVCLGAPEGRGVTDQPSFPRREALAPGSQSVLAASQCPNLKM